MTKGGRGLLQGMAMEIIVLGGMIVKLETSQGTFLTGIWNLISCPSIHNGGISCMKSDGGLDKNNLGCRLWLERS